MPYSKFDPDDMILRDHLAYDRTVLANERTLLSYQRTAIALLAAGTTLVKIFPDDRFIINTGVVLFILGLVAAVAGVWRFIAVSSKLAVAYKRLDELEDQDS